MYEIIFTTRASREFNKLTNSVKQRVSAVIDRLADYPRQTGTLKLKWPGQKYRIRFGEWRIIYEIIDKQNRVFIGKIVRRSEDTYRDIDELF